MPTNDSIDKPQTDKPKCHARRHMSGAEFKTYDAIKSVCKRRENGTLVWFGAAHTLANLNNRSIEQEGEAIASLESKGWLVRMDSGFDDEGRLQQPRFKGRFSTYKFIVVEHEQFAKDNDCPPLRYEPETGKKLKPGRAAKGLERRWVQKLINPDSNEYVSTPLGDAIIDAVADGIQAKKQGAATGNPVTVAKYPEMTPEQLKEWKKKQSE